MRTVRLPGTEIVTTRIGFGCAGLFRLPRSADRRAILESAYGAGIRHFDVAPMYGLGRAEAELSPLLAGRRPEITVTTKFGISATTLARAIALVQRPARAILSARPGLVRELKVVGRGPRSGWVGRALYTATDYSAESAARSLEHSLKALGTDYVDIFLLHDPPFPLVGDVQGIAAYLNRQRDAGRIRSWGVAGEMPGLLKVTHQMEGQGQVVQFRDDVLDEPFEAWKAERNARVTFGAMGRALPALRRFLDRRPEELSHWSARLGVDLSVTDALPSLLLREALRRNAEGIVLFTSTVTDRVYAASAILDEAVRTIAANESEGTRALVAAVVGESQWGKER